MNLPASKIVLAEVDSEITLLGSLFMAQGAFEQIGGSIRPEWFSDGMLRYMFECCRRMQDEGLKLTPQSVISSLPADCGGIERNDFYARVCGAALPVNTIPGIVSIVKDRWARRELLDQADEIRARADMFNENPYDLASEVIVTLDGINADRSGSSVKSLDTAMQNVRDQKATRRGASTGLHALDVKLNGYVPGQLYVIAGRPGMGKSAFMCSSLRRTAQSGKGVAIFSLEMTGEEIACRCLSDGLDSVTAPPFGSILRGLLSESQKADVAIAQDSLGSLPMIIIDDARQTWSEIVAKARQAKATFQAQGIPLSVVCIDHMGLVTPSDRYRGNKVAEAGEISGQARALAKELDCCVVLLCQLSREVEKRDDKRPVMSDLRWSGEIEQDAHVIGFLYREAYYLAQDANADPYKISEVRNQLEFLIRKNRNGETADVRLWCSIGHSMIRDE